MIGIECIPPRHPINLHGTDRTRVEISLPIPPSFCLVFDTRGPKSQREMGQSEAREPRRVENIFHQSLPPALPPTSIPLSPALSFGMCVQQTSTYSRDPLPPTRIPGGVGVSSHYAIIASWAKSWSKGGDVAASHSPPQRSLSFPFVCSSVTPAS